MADCAAVVALTWSVVGLGGCNPSPLDEHWAPARPLVSDLPSYRPPRDPDAVPANLDETLPGEPTGAITLRQAMAAALLRNPMLQSFSWDVRIREAEALTADTSPNPEVEVREDAFGGAADRASFEGARLRVVASQVIELGDKRAKRVSLARLTRDVSAWDYEAMRVQVYTLVAQAFVDVLASQHRVDLSRKTLKLAEEMVTEVDKHIQAGLNTKADLDKAKFGLTTEQIELTKAERELAGARYRLATLWGADRPNFDTVVGDLWFTQPVPEAEDVLRYMDQNPAVARWSTEIAQRLAALELAKANQWIDPQLGLGARYYNNTDVTAFIAFIQIPLPIFDDGRGEVLAARYGVNKARADERAARAAVVSALATGYHTLATLYNESTKLRDEALPSSEAAYKSLDSTFRGGGDVTYLDVIDAQRTYFEAQRDYIDVLSEYHKTVALVEGLIGQPLIESQTPEQPQPDAPQPEPQPETQPEPEQPNH